MRINRPDTINLMLDQEGLNKKAERVFKNLALSSNPDDEITNSAANDVLSNYLIKGFPGLLPLEIMLEQLQIQVVTELRPGSAKLCVYKGSNRILGIINGDQHEPYGDLDDEIENRWGKSENIS